MLFQHSIIVIQEILNPQVKIETFTRGFWHEFAWLGNSSGDGYYFNPDGSYIYKTSVFGFNRDIRHSGYWVIVRDKLVLITTELAEVAGGEECEIMGDIDGGDYIVHKISPPNISTFRISEITEFCYECLEDIRYIDYCLNGHNRGRTIFIGDVQYFMMPLWFIDFWYDFNQQEPLHSLIESMEIEMSETGGVTSEMIDVSIKYAELWKLEMEMYYRLLMDALDDDKKSVLAESQELWLLSSAKTDELVWSVNYQLYRGGSYLNILEADLLNTRYRERALLLYGLWEMINGFEDEK
jgi:hypothetical protein